MKAPLIHVAGLVFNEPLAIMPSKLETILHAIGSRLVVDDASLDELLRLRSIYSRPVLQDDAVLIEAQAQQNGKSEEKPYRLTPEGVAVIPVRGTLMKRFNFLSAVSGFSSYTGLGEAATAAANDPQVKAVLFDVDSPGGSTHGCFELSDMLYQMRGAKPMWAIANDLAASAAYALASAADRVWLTRTAGVGSVGVFALHADQSSQDEKVGVKYTYVFAGEKKTDGNPHEPLSKSAHGDIQAEVDRENSIFIATVARNRGFAGASVGRIAATRAGVLFAQNALPLLADEVGSFDEALEALTQRVNGSSLRAPEPDGRGTMVSQTETGDTAHDAKVSEEGEKAMAKEATAEELKRTEALASAAAECDDKEMESKAKPKGKAKAEDPLDDPDGDEDDTQARRAPVRQMPVAADNPAKQIAEMCQIAGAPELAADYIVRGYTLEKVIEKLNARRNKASAEGSVNSFVAGDGGSGSGSGAMSVDSAIEQARILSANSGGRLTQSQCMERLMRNDPEIYNGYLEERGKVAAQVAFTGGGRALTEYVLNNQRRYMANLGLSTTIEDVPSRRPM